MAPSLVVEPAVVASQISDKPGYTVTERADSPIANTDSMAPRKGRSNPCLQVTADHRIKMNEAPIGVPGKGEVLLHIRTTGICG